MRFILKLLVAVVAVAGVALAALAVLFLENEPRLAKLPPPQPEDVGATRSFVVAVRQATRPDGPEARIVTVPIEDLNAIMRLGVRFIPDLRTKAAVENAEVRVRASLPVPWPAGRKWLNVTATVPPFRDAFALGSLQVADWSLPPGMALTVGSIGANLVFGGGVGDKIRTSARSMTITDRALVFDLRLSDADRGGVLNGMFSALRGKSMPPSEEIEGYYRLIRTALDDGTLPVDGSFLTHLRFALDAAYARSSEATIADAYTAAVFGLAMACGAQDFTLVVGRLAGVTGKAARPWKNHCGEVTFAGRIDTRRHFITAAAIKAASNRGFAVSIGEFKELHDSLKGGSGFDFTDIVANNSGIRMSDLLMAVPRSDWPALLDRLRQEHDVLGRFDGVPGQMTREEFEAGYGSIDSPAFNRMIGHIEDNISRAAIHARPPAATN